MFECSASVTGWQLNAMINGRQIKVTQLAPIKSHHITDCFDLDRSKESGHAARVVCEACVRACVRVARCVTRDDMGVSSHRCWARFG